MVAFRARVDAEWIMRAVDTIARPSSWIVLARELRQRWYDPPVEPAPQSRLRTRELTERDLPVVLDLLTTGFERDRNRCYWEVALSRLSARPAIPGYPRYGYGFEYNGQLAGVILLIFSARTENGRTVVRCNGSSLYVQKALRAYAPLLINRALRFKDVLYLNLTPGRRTWPMLEAQGYRRFADGRFLALPAIGGGERPANVHRAASVIDDPRLKPFEVDLLKEHAEYGCVCMVIEAGGQLYPFVFGLQKRYGALRLAHLVYCRSQDDFVRFRGTLGRYLAMRGVMLVVLDANGPIPNLVGGYFAVRPKFYRGAPPPGLGDLPYTEMAMFGF